MAGVCLAENYSLAAELCVCSSIGQMAERDPNQEASQQLDKATESEPVAGEEPLDSSDLKRQLREAKERFVELSARSLSNRPGKLLSRALARSTIASVSVTV